MDGQIVLLGVLFGYPFFLGDDLHASLKLCRTLSFTLKVDSHEDYSCLWPASLDVLLFHSGHLQK